MNNNKEKKFTYIPYKGIVEECFIRRGINKKTNRPCYFLIQDEEIKNLREKAWENKISFKAVCIGANIEKGLRVFNLSDPQNRYTLMPRSAFFNFLKEQRK